MKGIGGSKFINFELQPKEKEEKKEIKINMPSPGFVEHQKKREEFNKEPKTQQLMDLLRTAHNDQEHKIFDKLKETAEVVTSKGFIEEDPFFMMVGHEDLIADLCEKGDEFVNNMEKIVKKLNEKNVLKPEDIESLLVIILYDDPKLENKTFGIGKSTILECLDNYINKQIKKKKIEIPSTWIERSGNNYFFKIGDKKEYGKNVLKAAGSKCLTGTELITYIFSSLFITALVFSCIYNTSKNSARKNFSSTCKVFETIPGGYQFKQEISTSTENFDSIIKPFLNLTNYLVAKSSENSDILNFIKDFFTDETILITLWVTGVLCLTISNITQFTK